MGCANPSDRPGTFVPEDMSSTEKRKYEQYLLQGKKLYELHCQNCHQPGGEGMERLYPPLKQSDYWNENLSFIPCIIKNGQSGSITVNGIEYNMKMPSFTQLTALEIAEIMTYVGNSWGNETGMLNVLDIQLRMEACEPID